MTRHRIIFQTFPLTLEKLSTPTSLATFYREYEEFSAHVAFYFKGSHNLKVIIQKCVLKGSMLCHKIEGSLCYTFFLQYQVDLTEQRSLSNYCKFFFIQGHDCHHKYITISEFMIVQLTFSVLLSLKLGKWFPLQGERAHSLYFFNY